MDLKPIPVTKRNNVFASHRGPGCEGGAPFYPGGQECHRDQVPSNFQFRATNPLELSHTSRWQTRPNEWAQEKTLRVYADPLTARSCQTNIAEYGNHLDSKTYFTKVGSKHLNQPRPGFMRTQSLGELRQTLFRDPTPYHFNASYATSNDCYGKFYSSHLLKNETLIKKNKYDTVYRNKKELLKELDG